MSEQHWGGYESNVYSNPEKCGLEIVEVTEADLYYEFDMVVLWRHVESGRLYWGADSGCSCPAAFEDVHSLSDLCEYEKTKDEYERAKAAVRQ